MVRDRRERGARQPVQEAHAVEQGDALREHVLVRPPAASDGGPRRRAPEADDAGDERQEERADEDDDEQDERHESEWAGLQELAGDDLEARFPDPEREGDGDERDRDREDPVEREAELRARPALPAAHLAAEAAADEAERALPQERHVEGVDEHVVAVELEDREQVEHELEDEERGRLEGDRSGKGVRVSRREESACGRDDDPRERPGE